MLRIFFRSSNETWTFGALLLNTEVRALTGALDAASYLLAQPGSRLPAASRTHILAALATQPSNAANQASMSDCAWLMCNPAQGCNACQGGRGGGRTRERGSKTHRGREMTESKGVSEISCRVHSITQSREDNLEARGHETSCRHQPLLHCIGSS